MSHFSGGIASITLILSLTLIVGCGDSSETESPAPTTTTTTTPAGGNGGSGGDVGGGGHGGDVGGGGSGGSGGVAPAEPCDAVPDDQLAVVFTAPADHDDGLVGLAGYVVCPTGSWETCTNDSWQDPWPGSVAHEGDDTAIALFGDFPDPRPEGTYVEFIAGLYSSDTSPAYYWFSQVTTEPKCVVTIEGTYSVCMGKSRVGAYVDGEFSGVLGMTDDCSANLAFNVPAL